MRKSNPPESDENQVPIDLAGCRWGVLPNSDGIRILIPSKAAADRLGFELDVPARLAAIRSEALQKISSEEEAFAQRNYAVGTHLYLSVSILTTHAHWRGGWLLYFCPPGEETNLIAYIHAARDMVVANLRKDRAQHGSKS
jgi:hypothetical protein